MQYPLAELIKHHIMIENIDNEEVPLRGTFSLDSARTKLRTP